MYAKLVNDQLIYPPVNHRGIINYNKYPEKMIEDGYKEVVTTPMPKDGMDKYIMVNDEQVLSKKAEKHYVSKYIEKNGKLVQTWEEIQIEEETEQSVEE